jgi:transposase
LTLEQKIALIKDNQNGHGLSVRKLADKYNISKSSAANILHRREEFFSDYTSNSNKGRKRKHKDESGQSIDQLVFEWFTVQRSKQIAISGPILQEKARQFAAELGHPSDVFKASNGWLEKFRFRHAISFRRIRGECASVDNSTTEEWTQRLPTLLDGYDEKDVFNADETGLFYRAIPDRSLVLSKEDCKGGKKSKERFTILLCTNWTGTEKLKPVVIGKKTLID